MAEEELKDKITALESECATYKADIEKLKSDIATKDSKIGELQSYICKNLTAPRDPNAGSGSGVKDFADVYKETLSKMNKK